MGPDARDERSTATDGTSLGPYEVEIEPYAGRGTRRVDLRDAAPFGFAPAVVLGLVALIDRADSAMVGGVLNSLQKDFGFSDTTAGILLSAPSVAALLLVVLAGKLADTRSRKNVLVVVIAAWGLLTFGAAAAPTFALFFLARVLLGMATPLNIPASASIAGDLYLTRSRTKAFAILRVMEYLGFPLGVMIGGVVAATLGWREAFLIMGVPAILLSLFVAVWLKEPRRGLADELTRRAEAAGVVPVQVDDEVAEKVTAQVTDLAEAPASEPVDAVHARDARPEMSVWQRTRLALSIPTLRAIILGQALLFAGSSGMFGFVPLFLTRSNDLNEGAAAGIAGMIGLIGLGGGGVIASRFGDRFHGVKKAWRVTLAGWTLLAASLSVVVFAFVDALAVKVVFYLFINFANIVALSSLGAATADVIPARLRGTGFAVLQFLVTIGSSMGALVVGRVSDVVIGRDLEGSDFTVSQVTDLEEQLEDAEDALAKAQDVGDAVEIESAQTAVDGLKTTLDSDAVQQVFDAQAAGLSAGIGALAVVLVVGSLLIFRARATYERDAAVALADEGPDGTRPDGPALHRPREL